MTENLHSKFGTLETQLSDQHTATQNALSSILQALGAPPPGPTTTLADISTQLSALNDSLAAIVTANQDFNTSALGYLSLISQNTLDTKNTLDLIYSDIETIISNSSLNAQRIIGAILSTACPCPTDAPLLPLPIDVTPTTLVDEAKCRRIQYYLSIFGNWLSKIANYGSAAGFITGDTLGTLLSLAAAEAGLVATGAEVGAVGGIPGAVVGAIVGLIMGAIFTIGGSVLVDYANQFNAPELRIAIVKAMYAADNAADGRSAFHSVILENMSTIPAEIIYALFWAAWSNDIYSGAPVVDDSAFDGTICAPPAVVECVTLEGKLYHVIGGGSNYAIYDPFGGFTQASTVGSTSGPVSFDQPLFYNGSLEGWTITVLTGDLHYQWRAEDTSANTFFDVSGVFYANAEVTIALPACGCFAIGSGVPFTAKLCPPGAV